MSAGRTLPGSLEALPRIISNGLVPECWEFHDPCQILSSLSPKTSPLFAISSHELLARSGTAHPVRGNKLEKLELIRGVPPIRKRRGYLPRVYFPVALNIAWYMSNRTQFGEQVLSKFSSLGGSWARAPNCLQGLSQFTLPSSPTCPYIHATNSHSSNLLETQCLIQHTPRSPFTVCDTRFGELLVSITW